MKLHIFNPEHDIALALNKAVFTAPHAVRELRRDMAFIPTLWADRGDAVLVDDPQSAQHKAEKFLHRKPHVIFITKEELHILKFSEILPWGWDKAICHQLNEYGFGGYSIPDDIILNRIRDKSNRIETILLMSYLREGLEDSTVGKISYCVTLEEIKAKAMIHESIVLKAPWSSSGRGIRFSGRDIEIPLTGWCLNNLRKQGGLIVEPYYNKVKDFAMEFVSDGFGKVYYKGLSLFNTVNGAYTGNLLATEKTKRAIIEKYLSSELLDEIKLRICKMMGDELNGLYAGPFGIDMMVVANTNGNKYLLDPCVEINLRRTMGHVALSLVPNDDEIKKVMRIEYLNNYQIKLTNL